MASATTELTPQQQFSQNGFYLHTESVLSPDLLARSAQALTDVRNGIYQTGDAPLGRNWMPEDNPDMLAKIDNPQLSNRALLEALVDSGLGDLAGEITGAQWIQVWAVQGLYKPPTTGHTNNGNVGWHQDQTYWDSIWEDGSELFTAWLALSNVTDDSGPMQFVPGSHAWGSLDGNFFEQDQEALRSQIQVPAGAGWSELSVVLPAGGVSFHHRWLLHGSSQNASSSPRMSMAIHLRTDKSAPLSRDHVLTKDLDEPEICPVIFSRS